MRDVIVAIDLETTGLDVAEAEIIEIGAVKFREGEILETYSTLIDPGGPIPARVTAITNIRQEDIVGAPKIADVLPTLAAFVGDAAVLGHNIDFDLRFLRKQGILKNNAAIDTYELASVLLPTTPRYNLNALMQELNIIMEGVEGDHHRALFDAIATARIYMVLWDKLIHQMPIDLLHEIVTVAQDLPWQGQPIFSWALAERGGAPSHNRSPADLFGGAASPIKSLRHRTPSIPLAPGDLNALIDPHQSLFPPSLQLNSMTAVADALNTDAHLLLEVPTGLSKALAFLLPAARWALTNGEGVVISNDRAFEREDELPPLDSLRAALGSDGQDLQAVPLKSRSHYLCPSRLSALRRRLPTSVEELRVLSKTLVWLYEQEQPTLKPTDGQEPAERISLRGPAEYGAWARLTAEDEECTLERCETQMHGICPFYKACRAAQNAHLVFVDHALLLADAAAESPIMPDYQRVILDDAHNLEETISYGARTWLDNTAIKRRLADLGTPKKGLLGSVIQSTRAALPAPIFAPIQAYVATIAAAASKMEYHVDQLFKALFTYLETTENLHNRDFLLQIRVTKSSRTRSAFGPVGEAWAILSQFTEAIAEAVTRIAQKLTSFRGQYPIDELEDLIAGTTAAAHYLTRTHIQFRAFVSDPDDNIAYWLDLPQDGDRASIHSGPIRVAPLIKKYIWDRKQTVILTSTTLRIGGSFDYLRTRLGAAKSREGDVVGTREVAVVSPQDYRQTTLIYLPSDMPEPNERERYQRAVERGIIELATATNGRLLVLFTSFTQLRQTSQNIAPRLALGKIAVFDQSDGSSLQMLLDGFRNAERAILLGSRGFWEANDLPASVLAGLVIVRLPFGVPSDPLVATRNETFDDPFNDYTVPDAILRFRQGVGWLIRDRVERSIITVFDKRLTSKDYGRLFLDSLPACTYERGPIAELGIKAQDWLTG